MLGKVIHDLKLILGELVGLDGAAPVAPSILGEVIAAAQKAGFFGIAVVNNFDGYIAIAMDASGRMSDTHRSWQSHATPEGALADLGLKLGVGEKTTGA